MICIESCGVCTIIECCKFFVFVVVRIGGSKSVNVVTVYYRYPFIYVILWLCDCVIWYF